MISLPSTVAISSSPGLSIRSPPAPARGKASRTNGQQEPAFQPEPQGLGFPEEDKEKTAAVFQTKPTIILISFHERLIRSTARLLVLMGAIKMNNAMISGIFFDGKSSILMM